MNKIIFYTVFFLVILFSCKKTISKNLVKEKEGVPTTIITNQNNNSEYNEISGVSRSSNYDQSNTIQKLDVKYKALFLKIRYIADRAYISIENENILLVDWKPLQINFFYDMSFVDAENDIHLLLKDDDTSNGYLLFPGFTEQYATYFIYHFKEGVFNYLGNYECINFERGTFFFNKELQKIYISSANKDLELRKIEEETTSIQNSIAENDIELLKKNKETISEVSNKNSSIINSTYQKKNENTSVKESWDGIYTLTFKDLIKMGEQHSLTYQITVDNKKILMSEKVDDKHVQYTGRIIKSNSDSLIFTLSNDEKYYLVKDNKDQIYISGQDIYMINPPNEKYLIQKIE